MESDVSVVISTYNRPKLLIRAIQSVEAQTALPKEILVIGDNCSAETQSLLSEYGSSLCVKYINLNFRCGEQSIPNRVGSELAKGKFVAFLNHDDVWLPNHLEVGLEAINRSGLSWFVGQCAFFERIKMTTGVLEATGTTPVIRGIDQAYSAVDTYFEPASSWVISRAALQEVPWRSASSAHRTPLADIALRICRKFGDPAIHPEPTVLKVMGPIRGKPSYLDESDISQKITELAATRNAEWQSALSLDAEESKQRLRPRYSLHVGIHARITELLSGQVCLTIFKVFGFDSLGRYSARVLGGNQIIFSKLVQQRTGEKFIQDKQILKTLDSSQFSIHYLGKHDGCECS